MLENHKGYYQFVKVKNFESNSQLSAVFCNGRCCYYQFVKVKNFESNSQLFPDIWRSIFAVTSLSKIGIEKLLVAQALL